MVNKKICIGKTKAGNTCLRKASDAWKDTPGPIQGVDYA